MTQRAAFPQTISFPLRRDSWHASFITRSFLFIFASAAAITFGLSLFTSFVFDLWLVGFLVVGPLVAISGWRRYSIGTAELNVDALVVKSKAQTQTYPWEDVEGITASILERSAGWIGLHVKRPVALVDLRHQVRESLVRARSGTRTKGPVIPRSMQVMIELEDVQGFVEAANKYLSKSVPPQEDPPD